MKPFMVVIGAVLSVLQLYNPSFSADTLTMAAETNASPVVTEPNPPKVDSSKKVYYPPANLSAPPSANPPAPARLDMPPAERNSQGEFLQGKIDGERDAKGNPVWILAGLPGVCCYGAGIAGMVVSYLVPPEPPESMLMGRSFDYILGYTAGYKKKGAWANVKYSGIGCAVSTVITIGVALLVGLTAPGF